MFWSMKVENVRKNAYVWKANKDKGPPVNLPGLGILFLPGSWRRQLNTPLFF